MVFFFEVCSGYSSKNGKAPKEKVELFRDLTFHIFLYEMVLKFGSVAMRSLVREFAEKHNCQNH